MERVMEIKVDPDTDSVSIRLPGPIPKQDWAFTGNIASLRSLVADGWPSVRPLMTEANHAEMLQTLRGILAEIDEQKKGSDHGQDEGGTPL